MLGRISCDNGLGGQEGAHAGRGEESKEKGKGTVPFAKWLLGYSGIRNESMPPLDLRIWKRALLVTGQSEEANDKGGKHPPPPPTVGCIREELEKYLGDNLFQASSQGNMSITCGINSETLVLD
ncbi:hypothetical protein LSTR_LSTR017061 [Laodelphax striatellus]|uniref:Uncharacterized protein n=1 Tax=Laodelphax striatellus TaxID=195883 RepID=A0A482WM11_LAOST|nr:hypothetical protein LSTR_LSTR017061 [Laodelphax striatellus]